MCGIALSNAWSLRCKSCYHETLRQHKGVPAGVLVDDDMLPMLNEYSWYFNRAGCGVLYIVAKRDGRKVYLHRLVLGAGKGENVDHIDGNTFDNRRSNLRIVKQAENCQNKVRLAKNNTSGFRGVSFSRDPKRKSSWVALAAVAGKRSHIGYFATKEEAGAAASDWRRINMPFSQDARLDV